MVLVSALLFMLALTLMPVMADSVAMAAMTICK